MDCCCPPARSPWPRHPASSSRDHCARRWVPSDKFDLLIKGGDVLDLSQRLRGVRDIGNPERGHRSRGGGHPRREGEPRAECRGTPFVTPGLIDLHSHVFPYGSAIGIPADELVPFQGTTTAVSAGDVGREQLRGLPPPHRRLSRAPGSTPSCTSPTSASRAFRFPSSTTSTTRAPRTRRAPAPRRERGPGDRHQGAHERERDCQARPGALERGAIRACELSGVKGAQGDVPHRWVSRRLELMSQILDLLRPNDILTHCYSGAPNIGGKFTNIVQEGKLLPAALAAKRPQRGLRHRPRRWRFRLHRGRGRDRSRAAPPDVISSDIHVSSGNSPGMPYLTWVMSKIMNLGFTSASRPSPWPPSIPRAPSKKLREAGHPPGRRPGRRDAPRRGRRARWNSSIRGTTSAPGKVHLKPVQSIVAGTPFGRPYHAPFRRSLIGDPRHACPRVTPSPRRRRGER